MENTVSLQFKLGGCLFLILQSVVIVVLMKYLGREGNGYVNSTVVFSAELVKLVLSLPFVVKETLSKKKSSSSSLFSVSKQTFDTIVKDDLSGFFLMAIPAAIYAFQNNLVFYALGLLPMTVYQVTYQMKILTTALFSVIFFKRKIPLIQQAALVLLTLGVIVVSLAQSQSSPKSVNIDDNSIENLWKGLIAISVACITSGLAGVVTEKMYKDNTSSLWTRNCQLGIFSILFTAIVCYTVDAEAITTNGFFHGWQPLTYTLPFLHAVGGMSVAFIIKYLDNIAKGFATSFSMVLGAICSWYIFDAQMSLSFLAGTTLVVLATLLYSQPQNTKTVSVATAATDGKQKEQ